MTLPATSQQCLPRWVSAFSLFSFIFSTPLPPVVLMSHFFLWGIKKTSWKVGKITCWWKKENRSNMKHQREKTEKKWLWLWRFEISPKSFIRFYFFCKKWSWVHDRFWIHRKNPYGPGLGVNSLFLSTDVAQYYFFPPSPRPLWINLKKNEIDWPN